MEEKDFENINFRVEKALYERVKAFAKADERSVGWVARRALIQYLDSQKTEKRAK